MAGRRNTETLNGNKFSEEFLALIEKRMKQNMSQQLIARRFGVKWATINKAVKNLRKMGRLPEVNHAA